MTCWLIWATTPLSDKTECCVTISEGRMVSDNWLISDELWTKMEPLLPEKNNHPLRRHRQRVDNRAAMNAILFCS